MNQQAKNPRIRYDEGCLAAHALNLIGDRWALLVVRELMFAPKRFQMIRAGIPGVTASVLTARLGQLTQAEVIAHDPDAGLYALTDCGRGLVPVLESLCRWALTMPGHDPSRFISPSALMISMGVNLLPDLAKECQITAGFDFGPEAFRMQVIDGRVTTRAVTRPDTDFVLIGDGNALARAVYGPQPLQDLITARIIGAKGDITAAARFLSFFGLHP